MIEWILSFEIWHIAYHAQHFCWKYCKLICQFKNVLWSKRQIYYSTLNIIIYANYFKNQLQHNSYGINSFLEKQNPTAAGWLHTGDNYVQSGEMTNGLAGMGLPYWSVQFQINWNKCQMMQNTYSTCTIICHFLLQLSALKSVKEVLFIEQVDYITLSLFRLYNHCSFSQKRLG